jgi:hypothetical protein
MELKKCLYSRLKNVKALTDYQINQICNKYKIFKGVFMRDQLPKTRIKGEHVGIINLDNSLGNGTHWCLFYINKQNKCYYFDSYAFGAPSELEQYFCHVGNETDYTYSNFILQNDGKYCRHLCILLLDFLDKGKSFEDSVLALVNK